MALGPVDEMLEPDRRDGAFRCGQCRDGRPHEDNDWCPVMQSILCEDCCRSLMLGDERMIAAATRRYGRGIDSKDVISKCTECPRLIRLVSEHVLADESEAARLPMH